MCWFLLYHPLHLWTVALLAIIATLGLCGRAPKVRCQVGPLLFLLILPWFRLSEQDHV
jgi:hypothetical protein